MNRDFFAGCTDGGAPIDLILVDAHLLFTRPPADAFTLSEVVEQIAGNADWCDPHGIPRPPHERGVTLDAGR